MRRYLKWLTTLGIITVIVLILCTVLVYVVDPFFHFHKPDARFPYKLNNQRYQNNGIVKHFDYDAIITGTSMTENFKASEFDELFKVNSIKVPFSGGSFREINENLAVAFEHNDNIKFVVRGLDYYRMFNKATDRDYEEYPDYLYDDKLLNDINYVLNVEPVLISVKRILSRGEVNDNFDDYSNWTSVYPVSKEAVINSYARSTVVRATEQKPISDEEIATITENVQTNIIDLIKEHPDTQFYLFYTPYSIAYMDYTYLLGNLKKQFEAEKYVTQMLLPYENIHLFSFFLEKDIIEDLNNYRDVAHYGEHINSKMLKWMNEEYDRLTYDNYEDYYDRLMNYYLNYDYDSCFSDWPR